MAALLDLEEKTYQRLERGENFPSEDTLKQITEKLDIDETALVQDQSADPLVTRSTLIARIVLALPALKHGDLEHLATLADGYVETSRGSKPDKLGNDPT